MNNHFGPHSPPKRLSCLDLLATQYPDSSRNSLKKWITSGRVSYRDNRVRRQNRLLSTDQPLVVESKIKKIETGLKILYEDRHLVVLDKPNGLLSVATCYEQIRTVHAILKRRRLRGVTYPVHRLDRETSGVMVFAYTEQAKQHLKQQLKAGQMKREYRALVEGWIADDQGSWDSYLKENRAYFVYPDPHGVRALTHYKVIRRGLDRSRAKVSLLSLQLETGRKNQIRAQAQEAGYPIVNDIKYGATERRGTRSKRLALHAYSLSLIHPYERRKLVYTSFPPSFFDMI